MQCSTVFLVIDCSERNSTFQLFGCSFLEMTQDIDFLKEKFSSTVELHILTFLIIISNNGRSNFINKYKLRKAKKI